MPIFHIFYEIFWLVFRSDPDFEEHFLKPELTRMICKVYPEDFKENDMARTEFRDKILQCCHLAIEVITYKD